VRADVARSARDEDAFFVRNGHRPRVQRTRGLPASLLAERMAP
jgi:hypothetical protein